MALGEALRSGGKFGKLFFTTLTNTSALLQIDMIKRHKKKFIYGELPLTQTDKQCSHRHFMLFKKT